MHILDELLEAWRYTREGVIAEVENLPADKFTMEVAGLTRTPLDLVNHIVESDRLMAGELARSDGDFQRQSYSAFVTEYVGPQDVAGSRDESIALLRRTHAEGDARLRAAGPAQLEQAIRQFNGQPASRIAWLHHGIAHEEYHRGQLALYARLLGETPALTRLILGS